MHHGCARPKPSLRNLETAAFAQQHVAGTRTFLKMTSATLSILEKPKTGSARTAGYSSFHQRR